jgi:hypothetical protein
MVRPGPLSGGRCARAGLGAGAAQPGRPLGRRPAGRVCSTGCALRLVSAAHAAAPSFSPGAARSGIARGPVPSRPVIPGPAHLPWEGRSTAHALDLEPANAARDRSAEIPSVGAAPLVTTGRSPREVPSICGAIVGGGAARWQAATALRPRWTAVRRWTYDLRPGQGDLRVTCESKTMRATSSGWPAAAATPSGSTPPVLASTRGSSAWRAVRSARVSPPTVTRLLMR